MDDVLFGSASVEWETPKWLFDQLNEEFHFTLDPCCTEQNAKCSKHYTKAEDGLKQSWIGEIVYCNPPYGRTMGDWIKKASESGGGRWNRCRYAHPGQNRHCCLP